MRWQWFIGHWKQITAVAIIVAAAGRVGFVASRLETAPAICADLVHTGSFGVFGEAFAPVCMMPGAQQAEFWIAEADRILAEDPSSEMARAAVVMLDAPSREMYINRWRPIDLTRVTPYRHFSSEFSLKTDFKCAELAGRAATFAPDDEECWRTRAQLMWDYRFWLYQVREFDLIGLLDEAARHDPENALYDYLAAQHLMYRNTSSEDDLARTLDAISYIERGLQRPYCRGADNWRAVNAYLARSRVSAIERPLLLYAQNCTAKYSWQFLSHFLSSPLADHQSPAEQLQFCRQLMRLAEQWLTNHDRESIECAFQIERQATRRLADLSLFASPDLSGKELAACTVGLRTLQEQTLVWNQALATSRRPAATASPMQSLLVSLVVTSLWPVCIWLALIAAVIWLASRILLRGGNAAEWRFAAVRQSFAWLLATGISLTVLGLAPSQMISPTQQKTVVQSFFLFLPAMVILVLLTLFVRSRKSGRLSLALLLIVPLAGVLLVRLRELVPHWQVVADGIYLPQHAHGRFDFYLGRTPTLMERLIWAGIQWSLYPGPALTIGLALGIIATWYWLATRRSRAEGISMRQRFGAVTQQVARTAGVAAFWTLLLFLILLPILLDDCQAAYEANLAHVDDMPRLVARTTAAAEAILADADAMQQIKLQVQLTMPKELQNSSNQTP